MSTLVILGASHAELPLVRVARQRGASVFAVSGDPKGLAVSKVDDFIEHDYSDVAGVMEVCKRLRPSGIVAGCNDFAAITASHVAVELGLPGHDRPEVARSIHLKDQFRELAVRADVRVPEFARFDDPVGAREHIEVSTRVVLIKPNDMTGGKGISMVRTGEPAADAIQVAFRSSRSRTIVVEDFVEGSLHSAAVIVRGGKVEFMQIADERSLDDPYLVSSAQMPSRLGQDVEHEIRGWVERIATAAGCVDGLVHVQFIHDGLSPWLIEMCRRPPGDLYLDLVRLATGLDLAAHYVAQCLGDPMTFSRSKETEPVLRQCVTADRDGDFVRIDYSDVLRQAIRESTDLRDLPTTINDHPRQKIRIVQARFESRAEMEAVASHPRQHFTVS